MVTMHRPVCLIEADDNATYKVVGRFSLIPVLQPTKNSAAIVRADPNASPYAPDCRSVQVVLEHLRA
jgi:hypothetical protein